VRGRRAAERLCASRGPWAGRLAGARAACSAGPRARASARTNTGHACTIAAQGTGDDPGARTPSSGMGCRLSPCPMCADPAKTDKAADQQENCYRAPSTSDPAYRRARKRAPRSVAQWLLPFSHASLRRPSSSPTRLQNNGPRLSSVGWNDD